MYAQNALKSEIDMFRLFLLWRDTDLDLTFQQDNTTSHAVWVIQLYLTFTALMSCTGQSNWGLVEHILYDVDTCIRQCANLLRNSPQALV